MPTRDRSRVEQVELIYINITRPPLLPTTVQPPLTMHAMLVAQHCLDGLELEELQKEKTLFLDDLSNGILKMGLIQGNQDQF